MCTEKNYEINMVSNIKTKKKEPTISQKSNFLSFCYTKELKSSDLQLKRQ